MLKQVLSAPVNTPDAAVYILTGILQKEAQIHKKTLIFFNNVCLQSDDSIEERLSIRQIIVKTLKSNSWFISVKSNRKAMYRNWSNQKEKKTALEVRPR